MARIILSEDSQSCTTTNQDIAKKDERHTDEINELAVGLPKWNLEPPHTVIKRVRRR